MNVQWENARALITALEQENHEAYFVGGCVRDYLLHREVKDIDITTSALPEEVMGIFKHVIPTGIQHGTVMVIYKGQSFEVTTFRSEGTYSDRRRPDQVAFISNLKEDLARRDFTINAMAMDRQFTVIDLFNGKKDLKSRQIKTVGNAKKRFSEDALRMLRALRFASQLGFEIEEQTQNQMQFLKDDIHHVAIERIKVECEKFFQGEFIKQGMKLLRENKLDTVLPIFKTNPSLLGKIPEITKPFVSFADVIALFHYLDPSISIQTWVKQWKCSNKEKNRALVLSNNLTYLKVNGMDDWLAYQLPSTLVDTFCHLAKILSINPTVTINLINDKQSSLPIQHKEDINFDGHQLAALYPHMKKGRWIAEAMHEIEYLIVTKQLINQQNIIKEWILCHPPDKN